MEDNTGKPEDKCDEVYENEPKNVCRSDIMTPRRIYKNVIVVSFVYLLISLAFGGLYSLQSSLHRVAGMGTTCQSVLYASMIISCLFLPKLAAQKLGHKHCLSLCIVGFIVWMAANGYAVWWTMVSASALAGISSCIFMTAPNAYITILSKEYAHMTGKKYEVVLGHFFGITGMTFMLAGVFAHAISSTVLRQSPPENFTGPSEEDLALCGINDCPGNNVTNNINLQKPAENLVWTLVGIYIGIAVIGLIVSVFCLDALPADFLKDRKKTSVINDLQATFRQLIRPEQLFLAPLSLTVGLSIALKIADWNKSFVACNLGIWMIGYTGIVFYMSSASAAFLSGRLVRVAGWAPIFIFAMCVEISIIVILTCLVLDKQVVFFVIAFFLGMCDAIWQTQGRAVHGFIFIDNSEAAFACYNVWKCVGSFIGFGYSSHLCTIYKLYVFLSCMVLGVLCYCILEWRRRLEKAKSLRVQLELEEKLNAAE